MTDKNNDVPRQTPWGAKAASNSESPGPGPQPASQPDPQQDPRPDPRLHGAYSGTRAELFSLALKTALLTGVTVGIYRFWERTRIRRFIWSATAPGGDPFEYTGTGKEKFLGFLIAVVVLGVVLGTIQLGLFFINLSVFTPSDTAENGVWPTVLLQLSFLVMLPLYFFAMYRAYRYRMSRTRWRGIRFGVLPGAWGYAWRYFLYLGLAVVSLGLLWPLMTFKLEEYRANRTFFGDARWHQGGRWTMLYPAMKHLGIGVALGVLSVVLLVGESVGLSIVCFLIAWIWAFVGYFHYRVQSYRILTEHKVIGNGIRLGANPSSSEVLGIAIAGGFLSMIAGGVVSAVVVGLLSSSGLFDVLFSPDPVGEAFGWSAQLLSLLVTLISLQIYGVFLLIFMIQPIYAHIIETTWIENPILLTSVKQRSADDFPDADGFADALDVGGAF